MYTGRNRLLRVVSYVAVEAGKDTPSDSVWELNKDTLLVCPSKVTLQDELHHCMIQLPGAVCNHIWRRGDSELFYVFISKVVWQLVYMLVRIPPYGPTGEYGVLPTFGIYAR